MSKTERPSRLYFIGQYDAYGQPLEFFGGMPGEYDPIPARDLAPEDVAALTEAQWAVIESPNGQRLYQKSKPTNPPVRPTAPTSPSASTDAKSVDDSSSGASS